MLTTKRVEKRLPDWLKRQVGKGDGVNSVKAVLRKNSLNTVCEEARCPNLGECFEKKQATFLILGDNCTRTCGFCSVKVGVPSMPDSTEPAKIAQAVKSMKINYVVITSVTRDDLADGGAGHFSEVIFELKNMSDTLHVEVLTPDFCGNIDAVSTVCDAAPQVYNHNIETVPSLYGKVRPEADYKGSLDLLKFVKEEFSEITTKSGLMLGLGENIEEVYNTLEDLRDANCDLVTIGQYMRPTKKNLPVKEYVEPAIFKKIEMAGKAMGFKGIYSGPLVRSSYNAEKISNEVDFGRVLQN